MASQTIINDELSAFVQSVLLDEYKIPGLALAVVRPDGEVELKGFGVYNDAGDPVTPDTLFGIASCSKAFSAFATCILMTDYANGPPSSYAPLPNGPKTFDWHTPVKALWPEFELMDKCAEKGMKMWDLVAHTSGIPTHDIAYGGEERDAVLARLKYMKPNRGLREEWQYNNMMFMTNAKIIELLSGIPYTTFVTERILKPLKMNHSTYFPSQAAKLGPFSQSFCWVPGPNGQDVMRAEKHFVDDSTVGLMAAGGGIISTARDMTNWIKCLLAGGVNPHTGERLCSESSFKFMTTAHVVGGFHLSKNPLWPETSATLYGGGLFLHHYQGHQVISHTGGTPGVSAYQVFCPNDGLGMVMLTNLGSRQNILLGLIHRITEDTLGLPRIDWSARLKGDGQNPAVVAKARANPPKRPAGAELPLPLEAYTGTYKSPSYGTLRFFSKDSPQSKERDAILSAFAAVENSPSAPPLLAPDVPQLFATMPRIWGNHLRLQQMEGDKWQARLEMLYPEGFGRDKSPFVRAADVFEAGFETQQGKVKRMYIVRYSLAQPIREGDYELAQQWFEKVE